LSNPPSTSSNAVRQSGIQSPTAILGGDIPFTALDVPLGDFRHLSTPGPCGAHLDSAATAIPDDPLDFSFLSDLTYSTLLNTQDSLTSWWDTNYGIPSALNMSPNRILDESPVSSSCQSVDSSTQSPFPQYTLSGTQGSISVEDKPFEEASPFQDLLSNGPFQNESISSFEPTSQIHSSSCATMLLSPDDAQDDADSVTSEESDPEVTRELFRHAPSLDSNIPSNTLPFILQSCE
jgi:hypothetical protein